MSGSLVLTRESFNDHDRLIPIVPFRRDQSYAPEFLLCPGNFMGRIIHLVVEMRHQIRG
jgi:hypothetical protein